MGKRAEMVIPINSKKEPLYEKPIYAKYRALPKQLLHPQLTSGALKRATRLTRPSECVICNEPIKPGEMFRDASYRNRAHEVCVTAAVIYLCLEQKHS